MVALMRPRGTFKAVWVRSHEEHVATDDEVLAARRDALAVADSLATAAHTSAVSGHRGRRVHWDWAIILDDRERPVVGDIGQFMTRRVQRRRQRMWKEKQEYKDDPARQTIIDGSLDTAKLLGWSDDQRRFYWRSIGYVLHTNDRKRQIVRDWDPHCRVCTHRRTDTQAHRFGAEEAACSLADDLGSEISHAIHAILYNMWVPDQEVYLPRRGHEIAQTLNLPTRPWWQNTPGANSPWKPLVLIGSGTWVHAVQIEMLVVDAVASLAYATELLMADHFIPIPAEGGRLLPRRLQLAVRTCSPQAAQVGLHPMQVCEVWTAATLHEAYRHDPEHLAIPSAPTTHAQWWIDDIYRPAPAEWWAAKLQSFERNRDPHKSLWVACYEPSAAYGQLEAAAIAWYVTIPAGSVKMRTPTSIKQRTPTKRHALLTRNPRPIRIGVISASLEFRQHDHFQSTWVDALQHEYDQEWLYNDPTRLAHRGAGSLKQVAIWAPSIERLPPPEPMTNSETWLRATFPAIYAAPVGWRAWPSATSATVDWAAAMTTSQRDAKRLHGAVFRAIWECNRAHWAASCVTNNAAIERAGETGTLADANSRISRSLREHRHWRFGLDTQIARRSEFLAREAAIWRLDIPDPTFTPSLERATPHTRRPAEHTDS